ncbi:Omega-hydroxypalmitate O-feruloyl transferase [Hibiscus syriacus]|uniref:Protein BZR1 homolog n=1 Tax=Hibiscus syriacus TaxID=106335 RepID=A0A6A2Y5V6_HIBSY|nr:Omega-hydroxypalmitate O-feruloyl transferase [Hibiscus syriacus]
MADGKFDLPDDLLPSKIGPDHSSTGWDGNLEEKGLTGKPTSKSSIPLSPQWLFSKVANPKMLPYGVFAILMVWVLCHSITRDKPLSVARMCILIFKKPTAIFSRFPPPVHTIVSPPESASSCVQNPPTLCRESFYIILYFPEIWFGKEKPFPQTFCSFPDFSMEPQPPSQPRRTRDASGVAGETSGSNSRNGFSYYGKENRGREIEKERTKLLKRNRRAFTRRLLAGLRQYGDFSLPVRSDMNAVLAALAREAGWTVESDDTTYRHCPSRHNQQNLREISARSGERPLSTNSLEKCVVKETLHCQPPVVRIDDNGMSPSQDGNYRMEKLSLVEATPVLSAAEVDHHGIKKGYSNKKSSEVARRRRSGFHNRQNEGHINGRNGYSNGCVSLFIENLPKKIHWKRLEYIFEARRAISNMNGSRIDGSKIGVSFVKFKPRHSYWRKSSTSVLRKSGLEDDSRKNLYKVEGVIDKEKLQVLSNCLVGWCKDFVKIGHLARQMQVKGLTGFTLMRAAGNVILMIFEDNASLRSVENDKSKILAEWFSIVEAWSESLVMECRRVWLICEGVPFHAWNWDTFKNIAKKWGLLLAIDKSCHSPSTFDRAKIQVLTKVDSRIDALVELKVGDNFFKVMVHEIEPSFKPNTWAPEEDESH